MIGSWNGPNSNFTRLSIVNGITVTTPSATTTLPEGDDYAKTVLGDPWDMNEITDIRQERSFNLTGIGVSEGILTAVSGIDSNANNITKTASNPQAYLLYPGFLGSQDIGKLGVNYPIDATRYRQLSFRMNLSEAYPGDVASVYWAVDESFSQYGYANQIQVYPGWHTYVVDLATVGRDAGNTDWGGTIRGLRLDPTSRAGVTIQLDWVRLTPLDTASTTQSVSWSAPDLAARVSLYATTSTTETSSSGRFAPIANMAASAGSYSWGTTSLPPGNYYVRAETGYDWATIVRGNSWDMSESIGDRDIYISGDLAPHDTAYEFTGGNVLSGTTTSSAVPFVFLSFSPYTPISGSDFYSLTLRLNKPLGYAFMLNWHTTDGSGPYSYPVSDTTGEWKTYTLDMRNAGSGNPWAGRQIRYLRIDPIRPLYGESSPPMAAGLNWQIDWVALTSGGPMPLDETDLAPTLSFSPAIVTVNSAPYITVTKPSMTTGADYATVELGNPWDMDAPADVPSLTGLDDSISHGQMTSCADASHDDIGSYAFSGSNLTATAFGTSCAAADGISRSDGQLWLNTGVASNLGNHLIDTAKYKYATFRYYLEGAQNTGGGWIARLMWWNQGASVDRSVTKGMVIDEGWNTYTIDLARASLESTGNYGWQGLMKFFRFDPNEVPASTTFHLDDFKLTSDDVASDSYTIEWNAFANTGITTTVSLYWSANNSGSDLHPIATGLPATSSSYSWNTATLRSAVSVSTPVYIYAIIQDPYNSNWAVSKAPVLITPNSSTSRVFIPIITKGYTGQW